jgi:hypothetical protein
MLVIEWYTHEGTITHGEPDTCIKAPAVVPFQKVRGLSFAFTYDDPTGLFGPNLVADNLVGNQALLSAAPSVNDCTYFGISDLGVPAWAEPFNNLAFHLAVAGVNITTAIYEYWNGAAWAATGQLTEPEEVYINGATPGIHFVMWDLPANWVQNTVNGITGYWVRLRITAVGGAPTPPYIEGLQPIYTVMQSHIEVSGEEIKGDIGAIIDFLISHMGSERAHTFMICAKKYSHTNGGMFWPYLPCKDIITGLPDASVAAMTAVNTVSSATYSGYMMRWSPGAGAVSLLFNVGLGAKTYAGIYRVYLRIRLGPTVPAGQFGFRMNIQNYKSGGTYMTDYVYNRESVGTVDEVIDLGYMEQPSQAILEANVNLASRAYITIGGISVAAGYRVDLLDLVLMPVDNFNLELSTTNNDTGFEYAIKAITSNAKVGPYALKMYQGSSVALKMAVNWDGQMYYGLKAAILGAFELDPEEVYWIYFFVYGDYRINWQEIFTYLMCPSLDKNQRYLLSRGNE